MNGPDDILGRGWDQAHLEGGAPYCALPSFPNGSVKTKTISRFDTTEYRSIAPKKKKKIVQSTTKGKTT